MPYGDQGVMGLTESDIEEIRELKGLLQAEFTDRDFTNGDAVMWAVENEIMRLEE